MCKRSFFLVRVRYYKGLVNFSRLFSLVTRSLPSHLFFFSPLSQLQHAAEQENAEELSAGLQERRRPRLHHVPACHHELPGRETAGTLLNLIGPLRPLGAERTYLTGGKFN